ncbi:hypothetical protein Ahu01nite_099330 [Winogradskya humida]|uniref:Uncharacterized protein n=1 Tax=Winogradskya humida TaxID=113566 RepID=A0ABQ4A7J0_9ACTN|nr:hypothetical protein Ahu01nite_099330 [Actinoplanes humidus]
MSSKTFLSLLPWPGQDPPDRGDGASHAPGSRDPETGHKRRFGDQPPDDQADQTGGQPGRMP